MNNELKEKVLKEIKDNEVPIEKILKVFIYGSRLFGTHHEKSDYDVGAIVDGFYGPLQGKHPEIGKSEHLMSLKELDIEIHFYEKNFWQWKLDHNVVEAIASLSIPKELVLYESKDLKFKFELSLMRIKYQVDQFKGVHEKISFQLFRLKNFQKGKKIACHCVRAVKFGTQILDKGYVYDFHCTKKEFEILMSLKDDLNEIQKEFYKIMHPLYLEFRKKTDLYVEYSPFSVRYFHHNSQYIFEEVELEEPDLSTDPKEILIFRYIKLYGMDFKNLKFHLDVNTNMITNELYQFEFKSKYPSRQSALVEQCCGLIIDKDQNLICYPFKRFGDYINSTLKIQWKNTEFYRMVLGVSVNLFFYKGEWMISYLTKNNIFIESLCQNHKNVDEIVKNMFWDHWKKKNYEFTKETHFTFMFVVNFKELYLVGVRNMKNFDEENVKDFPYKTLEKLKIEITDNNETNTRIILSHTNNVNHLEYQGIIVKEESNQRIIFKSKTHWMFEEIGLNMAYTTKEKLFIDIFLSSYENEKSSQEFNFVYKQHKDWYQFIYEKILKICQQVNQEYLKYVDYKDKEFFKECNGHKFFPLLQIMKIEKNDKLEMILFKPNKISLHKKYKEILLPNQEEK